MNQRVKRIMLEFGLGKPIIGLGMATTKSGDVYVFLKPSGAHISFHSSGKAHVKGPGLFKPLGCWNTKPKLGREEFTGLRKEVENLLFNPIGADIIAVPIESSKVVPLFSNFAEVKKRELRLSVDLTKFIELFPSLTPAIYETTDTKLPEIASKYRKVIALDPEYNRFIYLSKNMGIQLKADEVAMGLPQPILKLEELVGIRLVRPMMKGLKILMEYCLPCCLDDDMLENRLIEQRIEAILKEIKVKKFD